MELASSLLWLSIFPASGHWSLETNDDWEEQHWDRRMGGSLLAWSIRAWTGGCGRFTRYQCIEESFCYFPQKEFLHFFQEAFHNSTELLMFLIISSNVVADFSQSLWDELTRNDLEATSAALSTPITDDALLTDSPTFPRNRSRGRRRWPGRSQSFARRGKNSSCSS